MPDSDVFWYFLGAFVALVLGGIGLPPIPEEGVVVAAGAWVAANDGHPLFRWLILPVCIGGILVSDLLLYSIGRHFGSHLLEHRWLARFLTPEKLARIQRNFHRYGIKILLFVRWVPGIRSPLFLTAGTMRLPRVRFVIADAVAAAAGHTLLFLLSYWFTDSFKDLYDHVEGDLRRLKPLLILLPILGVGIYLLVHFLRKPVPTADPEELPIIGHQVAVKIENPQRPPEAAPAEAKTPADTVAGPKPVP
ncbi:MAG TPA: DedA family protein [Gemmataceae bacterium]|nr:DedA family protein [Gemmataceae bacterium]